MEKTSVLPKLNVHDTTINYLDGSEKLLAEIIADEHFDEFTAWRNRKDWGLYYHLSPLRKNCITWIDFAKRPLRILELGAGCGAITSCLVTIPQSQVVAVEGSLKRAEIIQMRCKNATNLSIDVCSLDSYVPDKPFDIVTLIGVLEYAGRYEKGERPFLQVLQRAEKWLVPDGMVICAIENQLGHKYIAGAAEDHYGLPYEGINNYPHSNGVRTFTKATLSKLFFEAGLTEQSWYYPYPDYKLPSVVYSDQALSLPEFDFMALADVPPEPNENMNPTLSERAFLSLVRKEGVVGAFMNSFIVIASRKELTEFAELNKGFLAAKSNVKFRAPPYQTNTVFKQEKDGIQVTKQRIYPEEPLPECDITLCVSGKAERYYAGMTSIFESVVGLVLNNHSQQAFDAFSLWIRILESKAHDADNAELMTYKHAMKKNIGQQLYDNCLNDLWLPGEFVDLVPLNVLIPRMGVATVESSVLIDMEWQVPFAVPLQLVFDRGMTLLTHKLFRIVKPLRMKIDTETLLPPAFLVKIKTSRFYATMNPNESTLFESWFQHEIMQQIEVVPPLDQFVEKVVSLVEKGMNEHAVNYYDMYRNRFSVMPELREFDAIVASIKKKLDENGRKERNL